MLELFKTMYKVEDGKLLYNYKPKYSTLQIGDEVGTICKGYRKARYQGKGYFVHRIIYMLTHDVELTPDQLIDHIDGNKLNNHPSNLRLATSKQNNHNRKCHREGKSVNVQRLKGGRWQARCTVNGKRISLGCCAAKEEAIQAHDKQGNQ